MYEIVSSSVALSREDALHGERSAGIPRRGAFQNPLRGDQELRTWNVIRYPIDSQAHGVRIHHTVAITINWLQVLHILLTSCSLCRNVIPQRVSIFFTRGPYVMSTTAAQPATTPIPVQLSETEFTAFILPHLSLPKRGPKCKLGYHRVFNLILWVLYTGMQWKCLPVPTDAHGKPAIHYTTVYKVFARWAAESSLWQAFVASVRHLSVEKQLL